MALDIVITCLSSTKVGSHCNLNTKGLDQNKDFCVSMLREFLTGYLRAISNNLTPQKPLNLNGNMLKTAKFLPTADTSNGSLEPSCSYAFGVVLYELISAKEAVVKTNEIVTESTGLLALFEDVLSKADPREDLRKHVDPRLGEHYPLDAVRETAQLAKACTQENPQLRPSMRSIVVALMTLASLSSSSSNNNNNSSSAEDWDAASFYGSHHALAHLMSGR